MRWPNWISLSIIVTLFTCMAQRLASFMRPTTYASAASCRHMMVLPWKHKSYLPTSRATLQTNCKKGSFLTRSSVLFWNCQISWRATVPGQYFLVFLTFAPWRKSFQGALPPMVGQIFLLTGSSLPKADGLAFTAIWANCQVGDEDRDLPTSSSLLASSTHFSASSICLFSSSLVGEGFLAGDGWWTGGLCPSSARALLTSLEQRTHLSPPLSSFLGWLLSLPYYKTNRKMSANGKAAWLHSHEILPSGHLELINRWCYFHFNFFTVQYNVLFIMVEEFKNIKAFLIENRKNLSNSWREK